MLVNGDHTLGKVKFELPQEPLAPSLSSSEALGEVMVVTVLPVGDAREAVFSDSAQ